MLRCTYIVPSSCKVCETNDLHIYIFAFGEYNSKQVNVSGIQIFRAQFLTLNLRKVMLNSANFTCLELYSPDANIYTGLF